MLALIIAVLILSSTAPPARDAATQDIPVLDKELVLSILLFEKEGLAEADVEIVEIRQLYEQAKVILLIKGEEGVLQLLCRKTDFGMRWGLKGSLRESLVMSSASESAQETAPVEDSPQAVGRPEGEPRADRSAGAETGQRPADSVEPQAPREVGSYRFFLDEFVAALQDAEGADAADYYYRESDFNLDAAEGTPEEALARISEGRREFAARCGEVRGALSAFGETVVISVSVSNIPEFQLTRARDLMPRLVEFYDTAIVEVRAGDGRLGKIFIEGLALMQDGWRLGAIPRYDLPSAEGDTQAPRR